MLPPCSSILAKSIYATIQPEFGVPTDLFPLYAHNHSTKVYGPLSFILSFAHNIWPENKVHTDLLLYMYTTIRPKVRVLVNLFILFVHGHSTKN